MIIDLNYLELFTNAELGRLLCGETKSFDVMDLFENTVTNGFEQRPDIIDEFWRVLHNFSDVEKNEFLQFVTGSPKPPFLGLKHMRPKFAINA